MDLDLRKFDPLATDHPLLQQDCPACRQTFLPGDVVTLVALGPGDDPAARQRAREGRPYNAVTTPVHWACATGEE